MEDVTDSDADPAQTPFDIKAGQGGGCCGVCIPWASGPFGAGVHEPNVRELPTQTQAIVTSTMNFAIISENRVHPEMLAKALQVA